jgi:hypothetical protein
MKLKFTNPLSKMVYENDINERIKIASNELAKIQLRKTMIRIFDDIDEVRIYHRNNNINFYIRYFTNYLDNYTLNNFYRYNKFDFKDNIIIFVNFIFENDETERFKMLNHYKTIMETKKRNTSKKYINKLIYI